MQENRRKSEEFSIAVNRAYSTLTDPIERALYILKLNGISLDETTSNQNPELLMLILQYNDEISKVKCIEDAQEIKKNVDEELKKLSRYLSHILRFFPTSSSLKPRNSINFRSLASNHFEKKNFEAAKDIVIQMKYYENISKSLKTKVQEMGLEI